MLPNATIKILYLLWTVWNYVVMWYFKQLGLHDSDYDCYALNSIADW